jgi:putative membrane protein
MIRLTWGVAAAAALMLASDARADETRRESAASSTQTGAGSQASGTGSGAEAVQGEHGRAAMNQAEHDARQTPPDSSGAAAGSLGTGSGATAERSDTSADKRPSKHDNTDLIQKLWSSNVIEVKAAEVAKDKAQSQQVKDFAERMEKDHGEMRDQLASLAEERNLKLDEEKALGPHKAHLESMEGLEGAKFDRHYSQMMVKHHDQSKKDVKAALKRAKQSGDQKFATVLQEAQKKIDQHHQLAKNLDKGTGQRMGRRGGDAATSAGARTEQGAERAGSEMEKGAERVGQEAEQAGEKVGDKAGEAKDAAERETR